MARVAIDDGNWSEYREVRRVIEYRDNAIYRTEFLKYVRADYQPGEDEVICPLPTSMLLNGRTILVTE